MHSCCKGFVGHRGEEGVEGPKGEPGNTTPTLEKLLGGCRNDNKDFNSRSAGLDRGSILKDAYNIINGERQDQYGSPEDSFALIANLWNAYLDYRYTKVNTISPGTKSIIRPRDVAMLMVLFKVARENNNPKKDNLVDIAGYAALADGM